MIQVAHWNIWGIFKGDFCNFWVGIAAVLKFLLLLLDFFQKYFKSKSQLSPYKRRKSTYL